MKIVQILTLMAPYLLIFSMVFAALLGIFLAIRARLGERHFNGLILPIAAVSHFLLSLGAVATLETYYRYFAKVDYAACVERTRQQMRANVDAVLGCDLLTLQFWRKPGDIDFIAYVAMSCALLIALFQVYRSSFERLQHVEA